jgi:hypothetical protein
LSSDPTMRGRRPSNDLISEATFLSSDPTMRGRLNGGFWVVGCEFGVNGKLKPVFELSTHNSQLAIQI